ncbi:hypothetical protein [Hephaestia mangrovi]|uniref:hypothetical protein n=1 Tax=Hephaestia mangrovi TaxID=2873268 RepID=UPI001CA6A1A1|nr:hypothetical protein [Hephaestia mangrovi]MBY8829596.1 hypothetical protein [Hephaestia mangrovi]
MTDPTQALWGGQPITPSRPTPEQLAHRARELDRRVRRRNALEYGAGALLIPIFGAVALMQHDWLLRAACAAILLGVIVVLRGVHVHGGAARKEDWAAPVLDHHRAQLVRQRDALRSVWQWYLAPLVPGLALLFAAVWRMAYVHAGALAATARIVPAVLIAVIVFTGIHWLNRAAARRLTRAIDALDASN